VSHGGWSHGSKSELLRASSIDLMGRMRHVSVAQSSVDARRPLDSATAWLERQPARDPNRFAPVIILSVARSCSSVFSTMLGCHPQLYGFPELLCFTRRTIGEVLHPPPGMALENQRFAVSGLKRAVAEVLLGAQDEAQIERAEDWLRRRSEWDAIELFDLLQGAVAPRIAVEKSPTSSATDIAILRAILAYPRARFIHLVRHPRSTIGSMLTYWNDWPWMRGDASLETTCAWIWLSSHARIEQVLSEFAPGRSLRVRAEDALNEPANELRRITQWLDVASTAEAIEAMSRPETSPFARPGPPSARGGNDGTFLAQPALRRIEVPKGMELPAEWKIATDARRAIVDLAHRIGY
jgi:hypothetical protein